MYFKQISLFSIVKVSSNKNTRQICVMKGCCNQWIKSVSFDSDFENSKFCNRQKENENFECWQWFCFKYKQICI